MRANSLMLAMVLITFGFSALFADTVNVDFENQGNFSTSMLNVNGLTITGSNLIQFTYVPNNSISGLGVVGGTYGNPWIEPGETVTFSFDSGGATSIELFQGGSSGYNTAYVTFSAVSANGTNLGSVLFDQWSQYPIDVSGLFGGVDIKSFSYSPGYNSGYPTVGNLTGLSFTPVPEPSALALALLSFPLFLTRKRRT